MSYLGQASHDERGNCYRNGAAGDQTGTEVAIRSYYNYPWNVFLEPTDSAFGDRIANAMIDACNNNHIGYDMNQRNTAYTQWKNTKNLATISVNCETDCSALTSLCITQAGLDILSSRSNAPTTSTLKNVLLNTGKFRVVGSPTKRGTILLKEGSHVAVFLGNSTTKSGGSTPAPAPAPTPAKPSGNKKATVSASSFNKAIAKTYTTTANLNMRNGGGTNYSIMTTIPKGQKVTCYGYYTGKFYFVTWNGYTGFCAKEYLK